MRLFFALVVFSVAFKGSFSFAWGLRGHHSICDAAVFLVKNENLASFLRMRPSAMGHLCNIPDIHWKNMGPESKVIGNPAHYLDPEVVGIPLNEFPLNYQSLIDQYTGKESAYKAGPSRSTVKSIPAELGSNWWRADQFFRRAVDLKDDLAKAQKPEKGEEQSDGHLYNKTIYNFYVNLGIMGHFVGDNAQPYHVTADYDGYASGHGGIHGFYEEDVVAELPGDLVTKILAAAKKLQNGKRRSDNGFLFEKSTLEKMRALAVLSSKDISAVAKLDPVVEKSSLKEERGMTIKIPAQRKPAKMVAPLYEKMIITHMSRAAVLLAQLWDNAYEQVGKPDLSAYKSYKYPFNPEFVAPDYFQEKKR